MKAHWKTPKVKQWYSIIVDGKCLVTMLECGALSKEKSRIGNLCGIAIRPATSAQMIKVGASTKIPWWIIKKMYKMYLASVVA